MIKIERVVSNRFFIRDYCWQLLYEWEDALSVAFDAKVVFGFEGLTASRMLIARAVRCVCRWVLRREVSTIRFPITSKMSLAFVMRHGLFDNAVQNQANVIPVIVDFWYAADEDFRRFEASYKGNPCVLITSKEVYEIVRRRCPALRVFHWALSLPDKYYRFSWRSRKKMWDCIVVGRPNPVMNDWLFRYAKAHPNMTYVINYRTPDNLCNYVSSKGEVLGDLFKDRARYMQLLASSKIALYSTPGIDNGKCLTTGVAANGYNQVTPRFLEYIAAGCHVMSRYVKNADSDYYEMDKMSPHVDTYEEFERRMDFSLAHDIDEQLYDGYIRKHLTSKRIQDLKVILESV